MYDVLLFLHFIGLALGVGTSFANLTLGIASRSLPQTERLQLFMRTSVLMRNGGLGLGLLLVSGIGMALMRGFVETLRWGGVPFHVKLALVAILVAGFGYLEGLVARARRENGGPTLARIPVVGRAMLVVSVLIVLCAVLAFH